METLMAVADGFLPSCPDDEEDLGRRESLLLGSALDPTVRLFGGFFSALVANLSSA